MIDRRQENLLLFAALWLVAQPLSAADIKHRFLAADESRSQLLYVDQHDPSQDWTIQLAGKGRDIQLAGKNMVIVSSPDGYREYSLTDQKMSKEVKGFPGAMSARRQGDGRTILACARKEVIVYELSADDQVLRKAVFKTPTTRLIRLTPQNTILFGCNAQVLEGDFSGKVIKTLTLPNGSWVYQAVRKPNGNLLVAGGYNPRIFELDSAGKVLKTSGGKDSAEAVALGYYFFAALQVLNSGDIVVCNWTGHGANDSVKGTQILQFDRSGRVVWKWHAPDRAGSIHGAIILDDLDPSVLNDDVSSVLGPVK